MRSPDLGAFRSNLRIWEPPRRPVSSLLAGDATYDEQLLKERIDRVAAKFWPPSILVNTVGALRRGSR
jgi:hypothetical protein